MYTLTTGMLTKLNSFALFFFIHSTRSRGREDKREEGGGEEEEEQQQEK